MYRRPDRLTPDPDHTPSHEASPVHGPATACITIDTPSVTPRGTTGGANRYCSELDFHHVDIELPDSDDDINGEPQTKPESLPFLGGNIFAANHVDDFLSSHSASAAGNVGPSVTSETQRSSNDGCLSLDLVAEARVVDEQGNVLSGILHVFAGHWPK